MKSKNKISFSQRLRAGAVILIISVVGYLLVVPEHTKTPRVTQSVDYETNSYKYRLPCDTIDWNDGDITIIYENFTGYKLTTESKDFSNILMGDYEHIDSMKCIQYEFIKNAQIKLDELRNLKNCD